MEKPICNVHTHTFNAQYVPSDFVGQFIPVLSKLLTRTLKKKKPARWLIRILERLPNGNQLKKFVAFLRIGVKESQYKIFHDLRNNEGYPKDTRFVVLPLNFEYMGAGKVSVPYIHQLNDLIKVTAGSKGTLLPFVYIDPRMGTAEENLEFVKLYVEKKGFVGIKLYPALGYYPYDPRLELVYEYAENMQLPILTHCSSTGVFYNDKNNIPDEFVNSQSFNQLSDDILSDENKKREYKFQFPPEGVRNKNHMARFADNFLLPVNYTDILEKYKQLKICFAHFGLDNEQHDKKGFKLSWHQDIKKLIQMYPNVYTDISYSLHYEDVRNDFAAYMKDNKLNQRILYGTDFFMTLQEVNTEKELYLKTIDSFGADFELIARNNITHYLTSKVYTY